MNRGLVQINVLHNGHLSKRRLDGCTRGSLITCANPHYVRKSTIAFGVLLESPIKIDILAYPRFFVVPANFLKHFLAAKLRSNPEPYP